MTNPVDSALVTAADFVLQEIEANKTEVAAQLKQAGVKAIDEIAKTVEAGLPSGGVWLVLKPAITRAINTAEPQIIAGLGGEEQALIALAEHALQSFAKAHGG